MKKNVSEFIFCTRNDFRAWLDKNAETSDGIWLILSKTKNFITITAKEALEEVLCFGWIDGQMKSIDDTKYRKYFAPRREKSPWSDKNKRIVEHLCNNQLMTKLGEDAIEKAKQNGMWDQSPSGAISDKDLSTFTDKLLNYPIAHQNFIKMPPSAKSAYVRRFYSFKNKETQNKDFEKIVTLLEQNLKPSINTKG